MDKLFFIFILLFFQSLYFQSFSQNWIQIGQDIDGEADYDYSGLRNVSISSDGKTVAIGSPYNNGDFPNAWINDAGHVRVYKNINNTWTQLGQDIDGEEILDYSGYSLSLSSNGNRLAIGIPNYGDDTGVVRVYEYANNTWTQMVFFGGEASGDKFGSSVSLSADGNAVAIGAPFNDGNSTNAGHVRVYQYPGPGYAWHGVDIDGEVIYEQSGFSVSLNDDGTIVAIGAPFSGNNWSNSGKVRVYERGPNYYSGWTKMVEFSGDHSDRLGISVSLSGEDSLMLAMGLPGGDGNTGTPDDDRGDVRVYQYSNNNWKAIAVISGEEAGDDSGASISITSNGIVAIGAQENDGNTGNNNDNRGHVRVYKYSNNNITKLALDIDGEAAGDLSGSGVALSGDGNIVAIGAYYNNGNGYHRGHVRVYEYSSIPNSCPVAVNDTYQVNNGAILMVDSVPGVLANDTDVDNNNLIAINVTPPFYGVLTFNQNGTFSYTHDGSNTSTDSFTYKTNDGHCDSNVATVTINIISNDCPVVVDDAYSLNQGAVLTVDAVQGVLANDTDADGDTLSVTIQDLPFFGTITLNSDGSFTYTHDGSNNFLDSLTYKVNDGHCDSNLAMVNLTIKEIAILLGIENRTPDILKIYPNPVDDKLKIELEENVKVEKVEFVDYSGKVFTPIKISRKDKKLTLFISNIENGNYILIVVTDKGLSQSKVVVER